MTLLLVNHASRETAWPIMSTGIGARASLQLRQSLTFPYNLGVVNVPFRLLFAEPKRNNQFVINSHLVEHSCR